MPQKIAGGCKCGQVRYECATDPLAVTLCYCRDCQQFAGGACGNFAVMPVQSVTITGKVKSYSVQAESDRTISREFCPECGSPLFATTANLHAVTVASFDDPSPFEPTLAIWLDSAPPWALIPPDIPQYPRNPPLSAGD